MRHTGSLLSPFSMLRKKLQNLGSLDRDQSLKAGSAIFETFLTAGSGESCQTPLKDQRRVSQASPRRKFVANQEMIHFSLSLWRSASRTHLRLPIKRRRRAGHVESEFQQPPKIGFHFP